VPLYLYANPKNPKEIIEVFQGMNDAHEFKKNGIKWDRVYLAPNSSIDTKINPHSEADFVNKTANKKGTMGDILDASREASEARTKTHGTDPVKQKHYDDYAKKRDGMRCMQEIRERMPKKFII